MRSVIVDYVRERMTERRGGDAPHVTLNSQIGDDAGAGETEILRVMRRSMSWRSWTCASSRSLRCAISRHDGDRDAEASASRIERSDAMGEGAAPAGGGAPVALQPATPNPTGAHLIASCPVLRSIPLRIGCDHQGGMTARRLSRGERVGQGGRSGLQVRHRRRGVGRARPAARQGTRPAGAAACRLDRGARAAIRRAEAAPARAAVARPGIETDDFLNRLPQFDAGDWVPAGARVGQPGDLIGPYRLVASSAAAVWARCGWRSAPTGSSIAPSL